MTTHFNTLIVKMTLDVAESNVNNVIVVASDTDVLVLLVYHVGAHMSDIYMLSEANRRAAGRKQLIPVREVCHVTGPHAVKMLLVIHALSGCDTTPSLYGHGKVSVMKKFKKCPEALQLADILLLENASQEQVQEAGCKLIAYVYSGHVNSSLRVYVTLLT
jgi:hypothetical protein